MKALPAKLLPTAIHCDLLQTSIPRHTRQERPLEAAFRGTGSAASDFLSGIQVCLPTDTHLSHTYNIPTAAPSSVFPHRIYQVDTQPLCHHQSSTSSDPLTAFPRPKSSFLGSSSVPRFCSAFRIVTAQGVASPVSSNLKPESVNSQRIEAMVEVMVLFFRG